MRRTETASVPTLTIVRPHSAVTFTFPTIDQPLQSTTITIPPGSKWTPSPHWHESYTEYIRVVKGRLRLVLNGVSRNVSAEDGDQTIDKFVIHEFMRADVNKTENEGDEGDVVVEEWVDPADGTKEAFFRNILSVIQDTSSPPSWMTILQIITTTAHFDNYDVYVPGKVAWPVTHLVHAIGSIVGRVVGLRPWYEEYTPSRLYEAANRTKVERRKDL